jgi:hypothetical protein
MRQCKVTLSGGGTQAERALLLLSLSPRPGRGLGSVPHRESPRSLRRCPGVVPPHTPGSDSSGLRRTTPSSPPAPRRRHRWPSPDWLAGSVLSWLKQRVGLLISSSREQLPIEVGRRGRWQQSTWPGVVAPTGGSADALPARCWMTPGWGGPGSQPLPEASYSQSGSGVGLASEQSTTSLLRSTQPAITACPMTC